MAFMEGVYAIPRSRKEKYVCPECGAWRECNSNQEATQRLARHMNREHGIRHQYDRDKNRWVRMEESSI
jgi:predicted small metal-binding protein